VAAFDKMLTETIQSRRNETVKVSAVDIPLPMQMRHSTPSFVFEDNHSSKTTVNFSLVLKKGHKQQFKEIAVPADSGLVTSIRSKQEAEREEQKVMKRLVLTYEQQQEEEDRKGVSKGPALKQIHQQPVSQGIQQQQRASSGGQVRKAPVAGQTTNQQKAPLNKKETPMPQAGPRRY
jgi:hypothetical protein